MKVFVAGASGAIGRPLVRQLVEAGHEVTGTTRREERAEEIRAAGAAAVVHALTAIPHRFDWKADPLAATNRLRVEGTRNLVAADGSQAAEARRRRLPVVGEGTGTFSFVHVEDAAAAIAIERGAPGTYNIVDDEPAPMREWVPAYCEALGAKPPRHVPTWLAALVAGRAVAANAVEVRGASNAKAKRELGWQPRYPSWRQGFADPEALG